MTTTTSFPTEISGIPCRLQVAIENAELAGLPVMQLALNDLKAVNFAATVENRREVAQGGARRMTADHVLDSVVRYLAPLAASLFVYRGGNHVAVHLRGSDRVLLVTASE